MAGLTGMAAGNRSQALSGLKRAADLEEARKNTGMQMKQAYRQGQMSGTLSGAAAGAMIGAQIGSVAGGIGAVPGALIGGIVGSVAGYGTASYAY